MAIDFPNSPVQGTTYTQGVNTWTYDGAKWNIKPTTIQGLTGFQGIQGITGSGIQGIQGRQGIQGLQGIKPSFSISDSPPVATTTGEQWYDSRTGKTYIWYDSFWIETSAATVANVSGNPLVNPIFVGPEERFNIVASSATGTINIDVIVSGVWYYTSNASANHTLNFRGNSVTTLNNTLSINDAITVIWMNTNGATPYYPSAFQIDGSSVTPKWSGGTAPTSGNASSIDVYSFTILKTASATFTVLASGAVKYS